MKYKYDVIVVGGGAAGLTAAKTAKGFGKKVLLIEKNKLGGECTWTGCVPSKALIRSAEIAQYIKTSALFGLSAELKNRSTAGAMERIKCVIKSIYATHTPEVLHEQGIDVRFDVPSFVDAHTIRLDGRNVHAKKTIIATGSHPFAPPIEGLDIVPYHTNETFFDLPELPKKLIILGGGPIGIEMASACNRLGSEVTVVEMQPRILSHEDQELVALLSSHMQQEGVQLFTHHTATHVTQKNNTIVLQCTADGGEQKRVEGDALLVAVGRRPNLNDLSLNAIGVKNTTHGIAVNTYLQTSVKNIYACGDVVGPYLFSHMAWHQAVVAARNACIPIFKQKINFDTRIWATFSAPEFAHIGLTEQEARQEHGDTISVYTRSYDTLDRAHTDGNTFGMAKVICDKRDTILGIHILGANAVECIHELYVLKAFKKKFTQLHAVIHIYPTYAEILWQMSRKAYVQKLQQWWLIKIAKKLFGM